MVTRCDDSIKRRTDGCRSAPASSDGSGACAGEVEWSIRARGLDALTL
jgi:hypothetical protein